MGFQEGAEDESLLTCIVCESPFGMTARFCGECGASREQALGVERARPSQRIRAVEPLPASARVAYQEPEVESLPRSTTQEVKRRKPSKLSNLRYNISMSIEHVWFTLQYHGRKVIALGLVMFIGSAYVLTQNWIFLGDSPTDFANQYVTAVSQQDTGYFTNNPVLTPDSKNIHMLPSKYNSWDSAQTSSWINSYSWNGWTGNASANLEPGAGKPTIVLKLKASSKGTLGVFRKHVWNFSGPMATVVIKYPKDASLPIYINNIYAGTVGNPVLPEGKYYAMPGPLLISFAGHGKSTNDDIGYFIDSTGEYQL